MVAATYLTHRLFREYLRLLRVFLGMRTRRHVQGRVGRSQSCNLSYASVNGHHKYEQSLRRTKVEGEIEEPTEPQRSFPLGVT